VRAGAADPVQGLSEISSSRRCEVPPAAYVLAGDIERPLSTDGSALSQRDREELARRLPAGRQVSIDGGHCLHGHAPADWLTAVVSTID
jgi:hypothetical protein